MLGPIILQAFLDKIIQDFGLARLMTLSPCHILSVLGTSKLLTAGTTQKPAVGPVAPPDSQPVFPPSKVVCVVERLAGVRRSTSVALAPSKVSAMIMFSQIFTLGSPRRWRVQVRRQVETVRDWVGVFHIESIGPKAPQFHLL
mmetsp:Transcript_36351/g.82922  ORF Transcript_36351/g.82922 Transcript_36351/m.82922 type:complete len:143 (+) Transcript_36351:415-843(+)